MKKIIAATLAAATALSFTVAAFAQENTTINQTADLSQTTTVPVEQNEASVTPIPQGEPTGLSFAPDKLQNNAVFGETTLVSGIEYSFPVSMVFNGTAFPVTEEMMKGRRFSFNKISSTAVKTFKIEEYKGTYYLFVELKQSVPDEIIYIKYNIKLFEKEDETLIFSQEVKFPFGYAEISDEYISSLDKGEEVEIRNKFPVISTKQFERIARINQYKNVIFAGPSWGFEVNVTDETTKNMLSNNDGVKEIIASAPEQDYKFFNFPGKPTFAISGKVSLDVDDIVDEFENMHTYRYANGKLYRIKTNFNEDNNTLEFRTNTLDSFFITNREMKEGAFVIS